MIDWAGFDFLREWPVVGRVFDKLKDSRRRRDTIRHAALKAQIVRHLQTAVAKSGSVTFLHQNALAHLLRVTLSELQPLLDELVNESRIVPGILARTYTVSTWTREGELT